MIDEEVQENFPIHIIPNSFSLDITVSKWVTVPSGICLLVSSVFTVYIIIRRFRSFLTLYLSVLLYDFSQLQLLAVVIAVFSMDFAKPIAGPTAVARCRVKLGLQIFGLLLPGYCILIITVVRSIFITFPLSHLDFIKKRFQIIAFGVSVLICSLLSAAPSLGLCKVTAKLFPVRDGSRSDKKLVEISICGFEEKSNQGCKIFFGFLLTFGFILPVLSVIILYVHIMRLVNKARKTHSALTDQSSEVKSKESEEHRSIPWSIIAILGTCLTTTLPWTGMIVYTEEITEMLAEGGKLSIVFDAFYSVLLILIGCSPLVYLFSTNSTRLELIRMFGARRRSSPESDISDTIM